MQPFQLFGATIPPLVGRTAQMQQLMRELSKQSPSHISVVGPRFSGKSVLLKALTDRLREAGKPFSAVVFWDLAHLVPGSDHEFLQALAGQLGTALPDYASILKNASYLELKEIVEALGDDGFRILMVWDGFDRPLRSGTYSRNLWDQLRELASQPALRLITSTRRPLQELIRSEESVTSDFWNIFGVSVRLGVFDDGDVDAILNGSAITLSKGARTEFANFTGLYPPLALALANRLFVHCAGREAVNADVAKQADELQSDVNQILASMWKDCDQPARELFYALMQDTALPLSETSPAPRATLVDRGLASSSSGKVSAICRLMEVYVRSQEADAGTLARQFGKGDVYLTNMRSVLQLRLGQIQNVDSRLAGTINECLKDLPENPRQCMRQFRDSVVARAVDLLLEKELGSRFDIPDDWINYWRGFGINDRFMDTRRCPNELGPRMHFLALAANPDDRKYGNPVAKYVSPLAFELCRALKHLGDFGVHAKDEGYSGPAALATVSLAIELAAVVAKDIGGPMEGLGADRV